MWWWVETSATVGYGDIVPLTWQGRAVAIFTIVTGFFVFANIVAICEYTAIADELILALARTPELSDREVIIVSDLIGTNPYPQHHFVRSVPISPVEHAAYVFVFANLRFADPDVKTLHVALRVAQINPRARVMVEMVDPRNDLLEHAPKTLRVMGSRDLLRSVLRDRSVDPLEWIGPRDG